MRSRIDRGWRSAALGLVSLILTLFSAGCNSVLDTSQDYADNAHIEITGTSPVPLLLVSSTNWVFEFDEETGEQYIALLTADTSEVELPVERTVALTGTHRIFFRVINPDLDQEASIRMRVRLDDRVVFDESATVRDASLEYAYYYR